jgi:hypothetical protein
MTRDEFLRRIQLFFEDADKVSSRARFFHDAASIVSRKNHDYAGDEDPFSNFKGCEILGIATAELGILIRMSDKLSRTRNLLDNPPEVKDESIRDTLIDLANYSAILAALVESRADKEE